MANLIHISLSLLLFFVQNWIGSRSYTQGYVRFSLLDDQDEAQSLNYALKVFGPIVYLIICAATFQYYGFDQYNRNIINIIEYYIILRIVLIFLWERSSIVSWFKVLFYYGSMLVISFIITTKFINTATDLLPDFKEIKNEIWLLIIVFLYQVGNGLKEESNSQVETYRAYLPELKNRKKRYINRKFKQLSRQYSNVITDIVGEDPSFELVIYSILIYENFNRPTFMRYLEGIWVRLTRKRITQGIMQVSSATPVSNFQSVAIGTKSLYKRYEEIKKIDDAYNIYSATIKKHCPDKKFIRQVLFIAKAIIDSSKSQMKYQPIAEDIKDEFELYDYELADKVDNI